MAIMERWIHQMRDHAAWDEIMAHEKQWIEVERSVGGFPPKQYYQPLAGSADSLKLIWERQWDSMSVMEQHYEQLMAADKPAGLGDKTSQLAHSIRRELFFVRTLA